MGDDQVVAGIDNGLDVVADDPGSLATGGHRTRIGVGQRDLLVGRGLHQGFDGLEVLHALIQNRDLLPQLCGLTLPGRTLRQIRQVECGLGAFETGGDLLDALLHLGAGKVAVSVIHRLKFAAVHGNNRLREQAEPTAERRELLADAADGWAVVHAEIGNRLEVRHQPTGQPHYLDIALGLTLQAPARLDAVQVAVEIDLQQR